MVMIYLFVKLVLYCFQRDFTILLKKNILSNEYNSSKGFNIILGDRLPTTIDIFSICFLPKSQKMQNCVHAYSEAPILQWTKAFGEGYLH